MILSLYCYSLRAQIINPKIIYVIDPGILSVESQSFSPNKGHLLENLVYWHFKKLCVICVGVYCMKKYTKKYLQKI